MAKAPRQPDRLEALAAGDPKRVIALMLWKARHREPDMFVQITEKDIQAFDESCAYQKLKPDVLIKRPAGLPAQAAIPATGNRRAVPGREATPPKPFVIVTLVEAGTENVIRPVENNEDDFDTAQAQGQIRKARDQAPAMADRLLQQGRTGEFSLSDITDAAEALLILARSHAA